MDPGGAREGDPVPIPDDMAEIAAEYREKLLDAVVETDDALMEAYLGGEELDPAAVAAALKSAVTRDQLYPVACGVATKNLGTHSLLDLLVEGIPSPVRKATTAIDTNGGTVGVRLQDRRRPVRRPHLVFRVYGGTVGADSTLVNLRDKAKERLGGLMMLQGKEHEKADGFVDGDIGAVAKLKDVQTGDLLADTERDIEAPALDFPEPVMSFAVTPKTKGDEDKVAQALRRLHEEDPTLQLRRDPQTGEQLLSGMSQVHVEVAVAAARRAASASRSSCTSRACRTSRRSRREARAQGRYKKQTGGRGQFGDCHIVIEPLEGHVGLRVRRPDRRRRHPAGLPAGGRQGHPGDDGHGRARRGAGPGRSRPPRRRLVPQRRLVGDGVQGRGLDGVQDRVREGAADAARADHVARGDGARRRRGRRQRRPQLAAAAACTAWTRWAA